MDRAEQIERAARDVFSASGPSGHGLAWKVVNTWALEALSAALALPAAPAAERPQLPEPWAWSAVRPENVECGGCGFEMWGGHVDTDHDSRFDNSCPCCTPKRVEPAASTHPVRYMNPDGSLRGDEPADAALYAELEAICSDPELVEYALSAQREAERADAAREAVVDAACDLVRLVKMMPQRVLAPQHNALCNAVDAYLAAQRQEVADAD